MVYRAWQGMRQRCSNRNDKNFSRYGGRGIAVCDGWLKFENFLADMGESPGLGYSLDRMDNNGDYNPDNCRWATVKEQALNRRTGRKFTINGATKAISEWCDERGVNRNTAWSRLARGWSPERAFEVV